MNGYIELNWISLLIAFPFILLGVIFIPIVRSDIYYHAFYGMSKTRKRKLVKAQSRFNYISMAFVKNYNYQRMTWFCLVLYWIYLISLVLSICISIVGIFVEIYLPSLLISIILGFAAYTPGVFMITCLFPKKKGK